MARDGEILNSSLLQKAADFLNLGGVKRMPGQVSRDNVQFVYDLANGSGQATPDSGQGTPFYFEKNVSLAGVSDSGDIPIIDDVGAGGEPLGNVGRRFTAFELGVEFDAAGQTAFNGKYISVEFYLNVYGGDPGFEARIGVYAPAFQVITGWAHPNLTYRVCPMGYSAGGGASNVFQTAPTTSWPGRLDAGWRLAARVWHATGVVFPANTFFRGRFAGRASTNAFPPIE